MTGLSEAGAGGLEIHTPVNLSCCVGYALKIHGDTKPKTSPLK
jgi:hypothetical protein